MAPPWSAWKLLDLYAQYTGPAVYNIRLCRQTVPAAIPRFLGTDPSGLLCIGKTTNMEKRRLQFLRGIEKGRGHSEANLLYILRQYSTLEIDYRDYGYEYRFVPVEAGQARALEETEIKTYVRTFGEAPPLNSAIPDRYGTWHIGE
jgi:hypothetical protein